MNTLAVGKTYKHNSSSESLYGMTASWDGSKFRMFALAQNYNSDYSLILEFNPDTMAIITRYPYLPTYQITGMGSVWDGSKMRIFASDDGTVRYEISPSDLKTVIKTVTVPPPSGQWYGSGLDGDWDGNKPRIYGMFWGSDNIGSIFEADVNTLANIKLVSAPGAGSYASNWNDVGGCFDGDINKLRLWSMADARSLHERDPNSLSIIKTTTSGIAWTWGVGGGFEPSLTVDYNGKSYKMVLNGTGAGLYIKYNNKEYKLEAI